jgi:YqjK-like protein
MWQVGARSASLRQRREALIAESAALRERVAGQLERWDRWALNVQRVQAGWRWMHVHRQSVAGVALAAGAVWALLRPRRVWRWARRAWSVWRLWQRVRALQAGAAAAPAPVPWLAAVRWALDRWR